MEGYRKVLNNREGEEETPKNVVTVKAKGQIKNNLG